MVDVSEKIDGGQAVEHMAEERTGMGLLSRFLGAVFLVLLGGLLLLDRALLKANQYQATLDAQAAGLLTEAFVAQQTVVLDRVITAAEEKNGVHDTAAVRGAVQRLLTTAPGLRQAWLLGMNGRVDLDVSESSVERVLPVALIERLHATQPAGGLTIDVIPVASGHSLVTLVKPLRASTGATMGVAGLVFDGDTLRAWLARTKPGTRLTLLVMSGEDTVTFLGQPGESAQALATEYTIVRLPTGGTWRIVTTHALTTRSLRWALWTLGVAGVLFLALGLLREQRRALQVAERSAELERLYSDVKKANQAKSEFLANISHELRTPLNAIVGFVELLHDGFYGELSPRQALPVDRISASATHLRHLVDQVLDIAKIAAGRLEVHAETIVLRPFVLNVASELESLVGERDLAFSITISTSLPRVRTDPTHLRQILINLIGNAMKYTPAGQVGVRARLVDASGIPADRRVGAIRREEARNAASAIRPPRNGTWVALQVVDTGVGIAPADQERIFDEFEQVNAGPRGDSMNRGTGLGLAISRRLARLLGGEIEVESELGKGSTFTVWLPVNTADLVPEPNGDITPGGDELSA
ncbi:MAG: ATP-binding region ATPase domain protein [Gemmatimonadetes bacterium]|nr:ATP-binding region ATPase domain protein [Gemmatimonadota bacterium]